MGDATKLAAVINNKKEYSELLKSGKSVLVDLVASWYGKCAMIARTLR